MEFNMNEDSDFTFVDFLPEIQQKGGFFTSPTFYTFRTLIDRANNFLRSNRKLTIITCESIEFELLGDYIASNEMTYQELGSASMSYVRGLRLWLKRERDEKEEAQQIDYLNLIPEQVTEGGIFSSPKFESLDTVIEKFNSQQRYNPIPGRIITIESQEMKDSCYKEFDPDRTKWTEKGDRNKYFMFVLRIFYERMANRTQEIIGVKDFVPRQLSRRGLCSPPKCEPFSTLVSQASDWLAQQQHLQFCNAQTLEIKLKKRKELDTQRMHYTEHGQRNTYFIRVLRVAYTKQFIQPLSVSEMPSPIREFSYKTFQPAQLVKGCCPEYENLALTKERVLAWVKATGAHVLSSETRAYRLHEKIEKTSTMNVQEAPENWIFIIRLYLAGNYEEPHPDLLPALPVAKCCCVVS